jgi:hypothetical protein
VLHACSNIATQIRKAERISKGLPLITANDHMEFEACRAKCVQLGILEEIAPTMLGGNCLDPESLRQFVVEFHGLVGRATAHIYLVGHYFTILKSIDGSCNLLDTLPIYLGDPIHGPEDSSEWQGTGVSITCKTMEDLLVVLSLIMPARLSSEQYRKSLEHGCKDHDNKVSILFIVLWI